MLSIFAFAAAVGLAKVEDPIAARVELVTSKSFEKYVNDNAELWNYTSPSKEWLKRLLPTMGSLNKPTGEEMQKLRNSTNEFMPRWDEAALPSSFDARSRGCSCNLRNQASCGGCWAFGAAETFTDNYCHYDHYIVDMSEQDLISCDTTCGGCNGGGLTQTWEWIQSRGITTESCLGFVSGDGNSRGCPGTCQNGQAITRYRCPKYQHYSGNYNMMQGIYSYNAAEVQFSVYNNFFGYRGGIYTGAQGSAYAGDHAVKAIGWGVENGVQYWIIQNSWGAGWGEGGYARIQKGAVNIGRYGMYNCPVGSPSLMELGSMPKIPRE